MRAQQRSPRPRSAALADPRYDSVVCAAVNAFDRGTEEVILALEQVAAEGVKPLIGVFLDFHPPLGSDRRARLAWIFAEVRRLSGCHSGARISDGICASGALKTPVPSRCWRWTRRRHDGWSIGSSPSSRMVAS